MIIKEEIHGKTLDEIEITNLNEWRNITVRFTDETSIHFHLQLTLLVNTELSDWRTGNDNILKRYPQIKESTR
jgi:hypothetical protein